MTNPPIKILLVDDREDNLLSMETILQREGYHFTKATSGKQALKILLKEFDFTLILMDVQMPDLNGFETAEMIHSREKLKHIPIIFITAQDYSEEFVYKGYQMGAVDFIYKPINPILMKAKVSVFVDLYRKNHRLLAQEEALKNEIAERKASEEMVKALNKKLEDNVKTLEMINSELEAFSYTVSHDLRAPLRGIDGFISLFLDRYLNKIDEEGHRLLNRVRNNVHKLGNLIDDLLTLSLIGSREVKKSQVDMQEIISTVLADLDTSKKEGLQIRINELPPVQGDSTLIKQVWTNLLSNSLKYSSTSRKPQIEIGSIKQDTQTVFYVKDNGVGFNMQYSNKLFGPFQRLHSPQDYQGTGVGLAIVKRITNKHGGNVWAEGKENEGATFYFSLPQQ